jgi:PAS domain S-box-containing protein
MLALRESQEKLQIIIDTALDAVVLMDAAGVITSWNALAESVFGWPRGEAIGRTLHETIIPPRYHEAHLRGMARFLATGESRILNYRIEAFAQHRDGREFPVELSIVPIKIAENYEFSAFIRDITERKRQEALINQHNELLKRQKAEVEATLGRVRRLEGLLSICIGCKKIRTGNNDWHQIERYIGEHSDAVFSHALCPECLGKEMKKFE